MTIGIVMPAALRSDVLLNLTLEAVASLRTAHRANLYLVCNALEVCPRRQLKTELQRHFPGRITILHEPGVERSVAGSWNVGCELALADSVDWIALVANDTRLQRDCLDKLVRFGKHGEADLWTGCVRNEHNSIDRSAILDGANFNCAMLTPVTLSKHGRFDPNYFPAYFEDNDYYGRIVLGGGHCRIVGAARFFHHGSMTIRHDPVLGALNRSRFDRNRQYFARKWGVPVPEHKEEGVLRRYHRHPFNDPTKPLSWFPADERSV